MRKSNPEESSSWTRRRFAATSVSLLMAGSNAGCISSFTRPSEEELKNQAETVPFDELYRNISEYEGEYVHYPNLRISDIVEGEGQKEYLLIPPSKDLTNDHVFYGLWDGDPYKENDRIEIWGEVLGLRTYTSLTGDQTVPEIRIYESQLVR